MALAALCGRRKTALVIAAWRGSHTGQLRLIVLDARSKAVRRRIARKVAGLDQSRELEASVDRVYFRI